jgi:hypothetical protein
MGRIKDFYESEIKLMALERALRPEPAAVTNKQEPVQEAFTFMHEVPAKKETVSMNITKRKAKVDWSGLLEVLKNTPPPPQTSIVGDTEEEDLLADAILLPIKKRTENQVSCPSESDTKE